MELPQPGDRILVLKEHWLNLIIKTGSTRKTMEIRGRALKGGVYWLGHKGFIRGKASLGDPVFIADVQTWAGLRERHRVMSDALPYRKTWGSPVLKARPVEPVRYIHPRGAVGIVRYRPKV